MRCGRGDARELDAQIGSDRDDDDRRAVVHTRIVGGTPSARSAAARESPIDAHREMPHTASMPSSCAGAGRSSVRRAPTALVALASLALSNPVVAGARRNVALREAIALAEQASASTIDARLQRDVAASGAAFAALPPLQNPSFEASVERGAFYKDVVTYGQTLLRFEVGGQRGARIREVEELVRAREARGELARAEVAGAVAEAFGAVLAARERIDEVRRGVSAAEDEQRIHGARAAAGDATIVDVAAAEAEVSRWRQVLRSAEITLVAARARLAQLAGAEDLEPSDSLRPPAPPVSSPSDRSTIPAAPGVAVLEAEAVAAGATAERLRREASPTIDVGPRMTRGDFGELRMGLVVAGTLPMFRRNQGEVARAEAEAHRARTLAGVAARVIAVRSRAAAERLTIAVETLEALEAAAIPAAERTV